MTVANFVGLARGAAPLEGPKTGKWVKKPFYDGLIFHRVIPGFMVQGGDPLGTRHRQPGLPLRGRVLARAEVRQARRCWPWPTPARGGTNGSQFFITEGTPEHLTGRHTIFGLCEPLSLVTKITGVERGPRDKPVTDVVMKKVTISSGKKAKEGLPEGQVRLQASDETLRPRHERPDSRSRARSSSSPTTRSSSRSSSSRRSTSSRRRPPSAGATPARWPACSTACAPNGARLSDGAPLPDRAAGCGSPRRRAPVPTTLRESQIADHLILMVALDVRDCEQGEPTIFVTKDVNLRIRADALGLTPMDYEAERIDIDELYSGMTELPVTGDRRRHVLRPEHAAADRDVALKANQYVLLRDRDNPSHTALGRFDGGAKKLVPLRKLRDGVWGIRPRNKEQHCALDLLLNDDIKLVTLVGKAGHRQDAAGARGGPAEGGRGAALFEAAGVAADLPARPRHRLPARRHRGEAQSLDAADLRQRRVPDGPVEDRSERTAAATRS